MQRRLVEAWSRAIPRSEKLRATGLVCVAAGEPGNYRVGRGVQGRRLPCYGLVFVSAGSGQFGDPSGEYVVQAPALIWLFPDVPHSYGPSRQGWTEHWVLFEGRSTLGYEAIGAWDRSRPVVHLSDRIGPEVTDRFHDLRRATASPALTAQLVAATLAHHLIGVARTLAGIDESSDGSIVSAVQEAFADDLSVSERARRLRLTPEGLRRGVKSATGLTPHELIIRTRLATAQRLLSAADLSVAEISRMVGYDDPAYFSRLFRRRLGLSPQQFRDQA